MCDLSATLLPNAGLGSGTFGLHRTGGRGVMLWGQGWTRSFFTVVWRQAPPPSFRTTFPGVCAAEDTPLPAGVFHGNRTCDVTPAARQRGPQAALKSFHSLLDKILAG